ncbi:MAG TPA: recombinase family protein, partial [Ktedonobacteraceae bacterium]
MKRPKPLYEQIPEHVAAYIRVSTDEQKQTGYGLADQRDRCRAMAIAKGWPEPQVYADEGISGTKEPQKRQGMAHLLADIDAGAIDGLIVLDLSRLGRKTRMVLDLVEHFHQHDVIFLSCKESFDSSTPHGAFVLTMFAALAQLERDLTAERTTDALAELIRQGKTIGRLPYGYVRVGETIQIDEIAARNVRQIFKLRD